MGKLIIKIVLFITLVVIVCLVLSGLSGCNTMLGAIKDAQVATQAVINSAASKD